MARARAGIWHLEIDRDTCVQCAGCVALCPTQALDMLGLDLRCADPLCIGCDLCVRFCPVVALALEPLSPAAVPQSPYPAGASDSSGSPG